MSGAESNSESETKLFVRPVEVLRPYELAILGAFRATLNRYQLDTAEYRRDAYRNPFRCIGMVLSAWPNLRPSVRGMIHQELRRDWQTVSQNFGDEEKIAWAKILQLAVSP